MGCCGGKSRKNNENTGLLSPNNGRSSTFGGIPSTLATKIAMDLNVSQNEMALINKYFAAGHSIYLVKVNGETLRYERIEAGGQWKKVDYTPPIVTGEKDSGNESDHPVLARVAFDLLIEQKRIKMVRESEDGDNGEYIVVVDDGRYLKYKKVGNIYAPDNQMIA